MVGGGALGALGFWAMPVILLILVPIILYLDNGPLSQNKMGPPRCNFGANGV